MRANERIVASPIRRILDRGKDEGAFTFDDRPLDHPDFPHQLADQLVSGVAKR